MFPPPDKYWINFVVYSAYAKYNLGTDPIDKTLFILAGRGNSECLKIRILTQVRDVTVKLENGMRTSLHPDKIVVLRLHNIIIDTDEKGNGLSQEIPIAMIPYPQNS